MKNGVNRMSKNAKTEKKIKDAINLRFNIIESSYQNFKNNPYSTNHVHRLRVELRKLRALLSFLKPVLNIDIYQYVNSELKAIGLELSKKRDLDTLIEVLEETAIKEGELLSNYADLFGYLEKERLKEADRVGSNRIISSFDLSFTEIQQTLDELIFHLDTKKYIRLENFVVHRFNKKAKNLKKKYKKTIKTDYDNVHELRKDAKKVRYAAVGFKNVLPNKIRKKIKKEAKYIQEDLGFRTDYFVVIQLLEQYSQNVCEIELKDSFTELINYFKTN